MSKRYPDGPCVSCGRDGYRSNSGLCRECSDARRTQANQQLRAKAGPIYDKYRAHWLAAMRDEVQ